MYCMMQTSVPSLHRESNDFLYMNHIKNICIVISPLLIFGSNKFATLVATRHIIQSTEKTSCRTNLLL